MKISNTNNKGNNNNNNKALGPMFNLSLGHALKRRLHNSSVREKHSSGLEDRWEHQLSEAKSGAGLQFPLLDCRARACTKGYYFTDTGMGTGIGVCTDVHARQFWRTRSIVVHAHASAVCRRNLLGWLKIT